MMEAIRKDHSCLCKDVGCFCQFLRKNDSVFINSHRIHLEKFIF